MACVKKSKTNNLTSYAGGVEGGKKGHAKRGAGPRGIVAQDERPGVKRSPIGKKGDGRVSGTERLSSCGTSTYDGCGLSAVCFAEWSLGKKRGGTNAKAAALGTRGKLAFWVRGN